MMDKDFTDKLATIQARLVDEACEINDDLEWIDDPGQAADELRKRKAVSNAADALDKLLSVYSEIYENSECHQKEYRLADEILDVMGFND